MKVIFTLFTVSLALGFPGEIQAAVPLPQIPDRVFNITSFGAVGDGKTLDTVAIQKTIDTAAAAGGGRVAVPAGRFLTGPFTLASSLDLNLAPGATILIDDDRATYPLSNHRYVNAITATNAHDLEISGAGTIDGQGQAWWDAFRANPGMPHRPYLIKLSNCQRVEVADVTLQNSPMFHLVPEACTDVTIRGLTIHSPQHASNTDGIDPSGWNFLITRCSIDTGDDDIAIKPAYARQPGNDHYLITDCRFAHGHGMSVGGGTAGGLDDLTVSNCTFEGTDYGIRIKTLRGNGGLLQHATYEQLTMRAVKNTISIMDWYPESKAPKNPATETAVPVGPLTPRAQDIIIRDVTATDCVNAGTIRGLPEAPITGVLFTNVSISAGTGMKIYHAAGVRFIASTISAQTGKNLTSLDASVTGLEAGTN